jgi:hypothetical protein
MRMIGGRSYKFKVHETKVHPRERAERRVANWVSVAVCIFAYYIFGANGWMLFCALGSYVAVRVWLQSWR